MPGSVTLNAPRYLPALVGPHVIGHSLLASLSGKTGLTAAASGPHGVPKRATGWPDTTEDTEAEVGQNFMAAAMR